MKKTISLKIYQQDWMPGFAGYVVGSVKKPHAHILLNVGAIMVSVKSKQIEEADVPYYVAEVMIHEMIHVLEEWSGQEFNHRKLNALMKKYEKAYSKPKKLK